MNATSYQSKGGYTKRLIVLSAPSGAGKTTLCQRLLSRFPELELSVSHTTRAPRGQEKDGEHYHFVSPERFQADIAAGRFAEWAQVHGNFYGTSKTVIEETIARGKSVLLDIDVQGAESIRKSYPGDCLTIFIAPPDLTTLEKRLRARGTDSEETIQRRLRNAQEELKEAPRFHLSLVNDELDRTTAELEHIVSQAIGARGGSP